MKLYSSDNHYTTASLTNKTNKNSLTSEMNKNKSVYLGLSILDISQIVIYEYCMIMQKTKNGDHTRLRYTCTDSFIVQIKSEDVYEQDFETRLDKSNYETNRPIPTGKTKMLSSI